MGFIFNFIKSLIKISIKFSIYLVIFVAAVILIPNLPPYTKFTSIELTPTQPRVGPLAPNGDLNNAEHKYKGKLVGPEAFQVLNGELYTSLATGEIVKISPGGHVTFVTKIGQPCTGHTKDHICGRPLGFEIDDSGKNLYVADPYYGIWKVDLKTDKKQLLVSPRVEIGKRTPKIINTLTLDKNGDFYWSDSSSDFVLKDGAYSGLADPSGRLFHYSAAKNASKVLLDQLWFPNGLALSPNSEFLVIAESFKNRLLKYYVSGPNKGKTEVFIDGLPGTPDNVRVLPDGSGILVGLYVVFDDEHPLLTNSMSRTPVVRKFLARLHRLIEIPFEYLNSIYPHVVFEDIVYNIGHFKSVAGLAPPMCGLLQADWNGNIVATYINTDKSLNTISEGIVHNGKLYIGSPHQDFLGVVPVPHLLKAAYETPKKVEAPKVETKPQVKPVEQAKPKVEEKPKVKPVPVQDKQKSEQKPQVQHQPKVETKPKAEQQKDVPKAPAKDDKPVQQAKPAETAKPVEKLAPPKTTPPPPKTTPPHPPKTTPTPSKQEVPQKAQKKVEPEVKAVPPPKPAEKSTPQASTPKPEQVKRATPQVKVKEPTPIKEDISSDTAKPTKETLKVIKRGGVPTEIPVPNQ